MDPNDILKGMQNLQKISTDVQDKLRNSKIKGCAGADMVVITFNGLMEVRQVEIAPELAASGDKQMLEDLICAALTDAGSKMRELLHSEADIFSMFMQN